MVNKCAKFANPMQASNFGGTSDQLSFEFFYEIFTEDASLLLLYQGAKMSKVTKIQIKGGPAKWRSKMAKHSISGEHPFKHFLSEYQ